MKHIPRFFVQGELYADKTLEISSDQMHHATRVLKIPINGIVKCFNGKFGEWKCEVVNINKQMVKCIQPIEKNISCHGPIIACAIINHVRFFWMLEKATELGVSEIIPVITQYTQYKKFNTDKAMQIIQHASEQCGRLDLPVLHPAIELCDFFNTTNKKILVGDVGDHSSSLEDVIQMDSMFLIGPEGGFSEQDKSIITKKSEFFSLGCNILRSETAVIASISAWGYKFSTRKDCKM